MDSSKLSSPHRRPGWFSARVAFVNFKQRAFNLSNYVDTSYDPACVWFPHIAQILPGLWVKNDFNKIIARVQMRRSRRLIAIRGFICAICDTEHEQIRFSTPSPRDLMLNLRYLREPYAYRVRECVQ